jgi:L-asparaginase/Glu-tRNA(Gln) amidotransferase subunit D
MKDRILLIRTGGTIDAEPYDPKSPPAIVATLKGQASLVFPTIKTLPNHKKVDGLTWGKWEEERFVKDSQLFTPEDIKSLADTIKGNERDYFILTHGTDAMMKNAELLQQELKGRDKVVVIVGAMVPLSMEEKQHSDGADALHFALDHITEQPSGVHIVGTDSKTVKWGFFDPSQVQKDRPASLTKSVFTLAPR